MGEPRGSTGGGGRPLRGVAPCGPPPSAAGGSARQPTIPTNPSSPEGAVASHHVAWLRQAAWAL
eukprot:14060536-Alexandrium_andersonii.AAC.1